MSTLEDDEMDQLGQETEDERLEREAEAEMLDWEEEHIRAEEATVFNREYWERSADQEQDDRA